MQIGANTILSSMSVVSYVFVPLVRHLSSLNVRWPACLMGSTPFLTAYQLWCVCVNVNVDKCEATCIVI